MKKFYQFLYASIVFEAYRRLGYYAWWQYPKAVWSYFSEKKRLGGDVIAINKHGVPAGTLMCARDEGWLPTDLGFPKEMEAVREQYGAHGLGYLGKFAVVPVLQGGGVGKQLLEEAITMWAPAHTVETIVMMVHPRHADLYKSFGSVEIARTEGTKGLEKAPAVLLTLELWKLPPDVWKATRMRPLTERRSTGPNVFAVTM